MAKTKGKKIAATKRDRKKLRISKKIRGTEDRPRVSIFRSSKHTYAQIISDVSRKTLVSASTLDEDVKSQITQLAKADESGKKGSTKSVIAAKAVGIVLAKRAKSAKVEGVIFDRNGFLFTGRVAAIAEGAREGGLSF